MTVLEDQGVIKDQDNDKDMENEEGNIDCVGGPILKDCPYIKPANKGFTAQPSPTPPRRPNLKFNVFRRSASAYFQANSISSMSRESTLKSSQGSLGVFLSQVARSVQ